MLSVQGQILIPKIWILIYLWSLLVKFFWDSIQKDATIHATNLSKFLESEDFKFVYIL